MSSMNNGKVSFWLDWSNAQWDKILTSNVTINNLYFVDGSLRINKNRLPDNEYGFNTGQMTDLNNYIPPSDFWINPSHIKNNDILDGIQLTYYSGSSNSINEPKNWINSNFIKSIKISIANTPVDNTQPSLPGQNPNEPSVPPNDVNPPDNNQPNTNPPTKNDIVKLGISSTNFGSVLVNNQSDPSLESSFKSTFKSYDDFVNFAKNKIDTFKTKLNEAKKTNNQQNIDRYQALVNLCEQTITANTLMIVGATFTSVAGLIMIASIILIIVNKNKM